MSSYWAAFCPTGIPNQRAELLRGVVRAHNLTSAIPRCHTGKDVIHPDRWQKYGFYIYFRVDDDEADVQDVLHQSGIHGQIDGLKEVEFNEMIGRRIGSFQKPDGDVDSAPETIGSGDDFGTGLVQDDGDANPGRDLLMEKLLWWLSAAGDGSLDKFTLACEALGISKRGDYNQFQRPKTIRRNLMLLGHIALAGDRQRWRICRAMLVRDGVDANLWHLSGTRTANFPHLPVGPARQSQPGSWAPPRISCRLAEEQLAALSLTADIMRDQVLAAAALPPLTEWTERLIPLERPSLEAYEVERYDAGYFELTGSEYRESGGQYLGRSGMLRLVPKHEAMFKAPWTTFFDVDKQKWYLGDWYGLRFLHHRCQGGNSLSALWSSKSRSLVVPQEYRWPFDYETVLVRASGLLPRKVDENFVYGDVSRELAAVLCGRLGVQLREVA